MNYTPETEQNEYSVETNEEFFNEFLELGTKLRFLSTTFQNEGLVLSEEEVLNFEEEMDMLAIKLDYLRFDSTRRFKLVNKNG